MDRPRVALLLAMTLCYLIRSDGESEIVLIGVSVVAPFKESEQLRSHEETSDFNVETDQPRVQGWRLRSRGSGVAVLACQETTQPKLGEPPPYRVLADP